MMSQADEVEIGHEVRFKLGVMPVGYTADHRFTVQSVRGEIATVVAASNGKTLTVPADDLMITGRKAVIT